jgi:hypothetical protein
MSDRSSKPEVRNPVLGLPSAARLKELDPAARAVLADIFKELGADARERAQVSWKRNKAPMAAYWKAVGAYATHLSRAVKK